MSLIRVVLPVYKGKRRFHIDKGRTWSVVEHLILVALAEKDWTAQALADEARLPRRVVVESIIRLMEVGWVELYQSSEGIVFSATEAGIKVHSSEELPTNPRRIARWRSFVTDRLTGTVYRSRELPIFEKHVLDKRAEQEQFIWIEPRHVSTDEYVKSVVAALFDDDERFVAMDPAGDRLLERYAVVTLRSGKVEGLPPRAPRALEEIIQSAAATANSNATGVKTFRPPTVAKEVDQSSLVAESTIFKMDDFILGAEQHRRIFSSIVSNCRHELIIHSTFISDERFKAVMPDLIAAVQRGTKVDILWGQDDQKEGISSTNAAVIQFSESVSSMGLDDVFRIHPFSTRSHAKLLVADTGYPDRHVAVVGSCNWLSSNLHSFEASVQLREPRVVAEVIDQIAELSLGGDGHWTDLTSYLARLSSDIRCEPVPAGARAKAHIVLGPDHGAMVRRARDSVTSRLFLTSHRLSGVGRPAVILPVIAAAEKNPGLQTAIYFATPSGAGAGVNAADVTLEAAFAGVRIRPVREPRVHAKILAWDDDFVVVTSQNWLSADPSESNKQKEIGVFIHAAGAARHVIEFFEGVRQT